MLNTRKKKKRKIIVFIAEMGVKPSPAHRKSSHGGGAAEPWEPDEKPVQLTGASHQLHQAAAQVLGLHPGNIIIVSAEEINMASKTIFCKATEYIPWKSNLVVGSRERSKTSKSSL